MRHKLLILGTFAGLAASLPSWAAENSGTAAAPAASAFRRTVVCRGVQNVPVTADAEQALPLHLVTLVNCGELVAIISDSDGYTVQVSTADGKTGYIARMYLGAAPGVGKTYAMLNEGWRRKERGWRPWIGLAWVFA